MSDVKQKKSVLIVDDESTNIIALTKILKPDYTVRTAINGLDALRTAEKHLPDIILLDVVMPDMDGYTVLKKLKSSELMRGIPVIIITALSHELQEEKGLALGAADYITKPFSPSIVKLRVMNQLMMYDMLRAVEYDIMNYRLAIESMNIAQ